MTVWEVTSLALGLDPDSGVSLHAIFYASNQNEYDEVEKWVAIALSCVATGELTLLSVDGDPRTRSANSLVRPQEFARLAAAKRWKACPGFLRSYDDRPLDVVSGVHPDFNRDRPLSLAAVADLCSRIEQIRTRIPELWNDNVGDDPAGHVTSARTAVADVQPTDSGLADTDSVIALTRLLECWARWGWLIVRDPWGCEFRPKTDADMAQVFVAESEFAAFCRERALEAPPSWNFTSAEDQASSRPGNEVAGGSVRSVDLAASAAAFSSAMPVQKARARTRVDALGHVIAQAIERSGSMNTSVVYEHLKILANDSEPPLSHAQGDEIWYDAGGEKRVFTKKALDARLRRTRSRSGDKPG